MLCTSCGRDSTNRRVCPFCFTPYPPPEDANATSLRRSGNTPRVSPERTLTQTLEHVARDSQAFVMRQTPVVRWVGLGIALVLVFWAFSGGDEAPARGANSSDAAGSPVAGGLPEMTRDQAVAHMQTIRSNSLVEMHNDEVFVSFTAANFPVSEDGQLALVKQFVRADELVEGRRRRIFFHNPNGRLFAQSDVVTGVTIK
jgi:hypothetical protein